MAKVLFIQQEPSEKFGTMVLSAVLKQAGHQVELFIEVLEKGSVSDFCRHYQPSVVAFSITTLEKDWALSLAGQLKRKFKVITIFGGAEPTYNPLIIKERSVDFVCRGEGDEAVLELVQAIEKGEGARGIKNIWGKTGKRICRNPLRNLYLDLNKLPVPDREIYYKYSLLKNLSTKKFLCSRGCPYNCTYCSNHAYLKLVKGLGKFIRFRSPESVIREIKEVKSKYGFKTVYFADETFTLNRSWLSQFLKLYRKQINLPFSCLGRVNELDEKTIRTLKKSGCFYVAFGLESGSERIRNGILKRNMKDADFLKVARCLKKYKIPFLTHQMYVLPTESIPEAIQTVELNAKMGTDSVWDTVFQPFVNTEIYDYCWRHKLLPKELKVDSMFGSSKIKNPDKKVIENLRKLAWITIRLSWLMPVTKRLIYFPNNPLFWLILKISEVYSIKRRWRLRYTEMIQLAWRTGNKLG